MKTWPEVRSSSPATAWSSVDLPEPDGPMMAVKPPAAKSTRHAVEGAHGGVALAVDLDGIDGAGGRRGRQAGRIAMALTRVAVVVGCVVESCRHGAPRRPSIVGPSGGRPVPLRAEASGRRPTQG